MTTQRRPRAWSDTLINQIILSGSFINPLDLLLQIADTDRKTVIRTIGDLTVVPDNRNAALDSVMSIDLGIGVCAREAFTAAVTPDPNNQTDYPALGWLYATSQVLHINNSSGTVESYHFPRWHWDIGANRKVDKGVCYVAINNTVADGSGIDIRVIGRIRALALT